MDDFFASFRPPTIFSLFPDAIGVVLTHIQLDNETMATLARVNREVALLDAPCSTNTSIRLSKPFFCSPYISSHTSQMSACPPL